MKTKHLVVGYRFSFALLGLSAVITEIVTLVHRGIFNPANFFSYFTIQSNLLAIGIFIASALCLLTKKYTKTITMLRGANTFNMVVVGIVFTLLLSGLESDLTAVPWDNTVLHYIIPVAAAIDWLVVSSRVKVTFAQGLVWIVYPVIYVAYSLIRGRIVGWYPYPFLNPAQQGYFGVAITCALITLGSFVVVYAVTRTSGRELAHL